MDLTYSAEDEAFRAEVKNYMKALDHEATATAFNDRRYEVHS